MKRPTTISEQEALSRLMALCSRSEHSEGELLAKLRQWKIDDAAQARIMKQLTQQKFVDDERFTRAFIRDKIEYSKWGRRKIDQALWAKGIDEKTRRQALDAIDDATYLAVLRPLINSKRRQTHATSEWEMNGKLVRFALSRGFTMQLISQCIDNADNGDYDDEGME